MGDAVKKVLTEIFNICMEISEVPKAWKRSNIIPIPKKEDWDNDLDNLRPIALLETPRKLFTRIMTQRLGGALVKNDILAHNNWAGLPGGSTEHPIIVMENVIEEV